MKKNFRLHFLIFLFSLAFLAVIFRLYQLQIKEAQFWKLKASLQIKAIKSLKPVWRGDIFVHQKEKLIPVAISKKFDACFVVPKEIERVSGIIEKEKILELIEKYRDR